MAKKPQDDLTQRTVDGIIWVASEFRFDGKQWKNFAEELTNRGITSVTKKPFSPDSLRSFCKRHKIDFSKIRMVPDLTPRSDPEDLTIMRMESKSEVLRAAEDSIDPMVKNILARRSKETEDTTGVGEATTGIETGAAEVVPTDVVVDTTEREVAADTIEVRFDEVEPYSLPHPTTSEVSVGEEIKITSESKILPPQIETLPQQAAPLPQWLLDDLDSLKTMVEWWKASSKEGVALLDITERRPIFVGATRNTGIRINVEILKRAVAKAQDEKMRTGGNLSQLVEWLMWKYLGEPGDIVAGFDSKQHPS